MIQPASRKTTLPIVLRTTELVAADAQGTRRLLKLPRLRPHAPADLGQEQVQRLLEGVATVLSRKEQRRVLDPARQVWLATWQRQLILPQEDPVTFESLLQSLAVVARIYSSELCPAYHNTGIPA